MQISNTYTFPVLNRIDSDSGRKYVTPEGEHLPSVTTILSATKENEIGLIKWRERVGEDEANRIVKESTDIGTALHSNLENHLLTNTPPTGSVLVKLMTKLVIDKGLTNVSTVWGLESPLYAKGLFAGTTDLIATYKGNLAIVDYKNSKTIKKEEYVLDYYTQLCAYSMAFNEMFNENIKVGYILMASRDLKFKEYELSGSNFIKHKSIWDSKLEKFYGSDKYNNKI